MAEGYEKFRQFVTSSGRIAIGGKSAEQNEELVTDFTGKENIIMHTAEAGSPFCIILDIPSKEDLKETAVFCARYSREWKKKKGDVLVHVFSGKEVYKDKIMKTGTFGVRKITSKIKVKKEDTENFVDKKC